MYRCCFVLEGFVFEQVNDRETLLGFDNFIIFNASNISKKPYVWSHVQEEHAYCTYKYWKYLHLTLFHQNRLH
jgi:hypothetical protein